jgi:hypothetical protein
LINENVKQYVPFKSGLTPQCRHLRRDTMGRSPEQGVGV